MYLDGFVQNSYQWFCNHGFLSNAWFTSRRSPLSISFPLLYGYSIELEWRLWQLIFISLRQGGPSISHLFSTYDSLFFFQATMEACTSMNHMIARFCIISVQMVNLQKLFIKFIPSIPLNSQQEYKTILRMEANTSIGLYLGAPIDIQGSKCHHFTPLLEKISTKISQRSHRNLS